MKYIPVFFVALLLVGCDALMSFLEPEGASLPKMIELHVGQTRFLPVEGIFITFDKVTQDSRCPTGAVCVWEGDGTAALRFRQRNWSTTACTLHTTLMPKSVEISNLIVTLTKLTPYPVLGGSIDPTEYVAVLEIKKSGINQ